MSDENSIVHRIALLDILRGFALIGILFPNIFAVADIRWLESPEDQWIRDSWAYFFKGRFFPIFSLLFGIGFFLFTENAERKGLPAKRLLKRRLWLLLLLGIPHQFFHPGEALLYYAIFGFLLFPLGGLSQRVQLLVTVLLLIGGVLTTSAFL
ncbi:MAG: heparan-alpha-glucosaminide N-acetyltransferase domain-containing protein, partial [Verrucomicrobiales bacterium]|nr:heparan-alpha-glucosaminide N-acetyltransferase domain-containing protein [Verrucomicrobiales bacterium]